MKRMTLYLVLLLCIGGSSRELFAQGIIFTFANSQITGSMQKSLEFDIMVAATEAGSNIGTTEIYINYNTAGFGEYIKENNKVDISHGALFTENAPPADPFYTIQPNDYSSSVLSVKLIYSQPGPPTFAPELPTIPEQLLHLKIEIADENQTSGLSFDSGLMQGKQFQFNNSTPYDPVIATSTLDVALPVELSSFNAVAGSDKVVLTWTTQSEINNQGFEVYRSTQEGGAYALIVSYENNEALQGAGNSNTERSYRYEDRLITGGETYWYQIADVDYSGVRTFHGPVSAAAPEVVAERYFLHPNYPNPFNPETNIRFEVPVNAISSKVKLTVYNNLGMAVRTLINGSVEPGIHSLTWDGRNNYGELMASGVYFLRIEAGTFSQTRKMLLTR